jgi:anti-sigma factor RsiW
MNVTQNVVTDLLPLYLAGEASDDTRALIEAYLKQNPTFAAEVREQAEKSTALRDALRAVPSADHEKLTLQRVRRFNRRRANLLGVSIAMTLMPLAFGFDGSHIHWMMLRDQPGQALAFWIAAAGSWIAYYLTGRRLRTVAR